MTTTTSEQATDAAQSETQPVLCGHQVNTAKGTKSCVKLKGHDTEGTPEYEAQGKGHASRLQIRKEYAEIPENVLVSLEAVPSDVEVEYGGGKQEERKEDQKKIDADVLANYKNWVSAGKPKLTFNEAIKAGLASRYIVPPKLDEAIRAKIRSAARYNGVGVRILPKLTKLQNGKWALYWTAQDVQPHQGKIQAAQTAQVTETTPETAGEPTAPSAA